jgi:hypothetical protein
MATLPIKLWPGIKIRQLHLFGPVPRPSIRTGHQSIASGIKTSMDRHLSARTKFYRAKSEA